MARATLKGLGLVLLIAACSPGESERTAGDDLEEGVTVFLDAFLGAIAARDSVALRAAYTSDGRFVWIEDGEVRYRTAEDALASLGTLPAGTRIHTQLEDLTIVPAGGEGAHAWASFTTSVGDGPDSFSFEGVISFVLERDGGSWKLIGGHTSSRPASEDSGRALRGGRPAAGDYVAIESDSSFTVTLTDGRTVRFADTLRGGPRGRDYSVEGVLEEIGGVLVHVQFWEGSAYLLLQRTTGDTIALDAAPIFSPNRSHFLTASLDLEAGYVPNRVRIYRVSPDTIELAWSLEAEEGDWGPAGAEWMAEDTVRFFRTARQEGAELRCLRTPMAVVRSETGWRTQQLGGTQDIVPGPCR